MHKIFILFHTPTQSWRMFSREKIELYLPYFAQIFLDSPVPLKQNLNRKIIFIKQFIKYLMKKKHHKISTIINYFVRWTYEEIGKCLAYPLEHPPWAKRGVKDRRPNTIRIHNKNNENCICCIILLHLLQNVKYSLSRPINKYDHPLSSPSSYLHPSSSNQNVKNVIRCKPRENFCHHMNWLRLILELSQVHWK